MRGSGPPVHSAAPRSSPGAEAKTEDDIKADPRQGRRGLEAEANARNHDRRKGRRALATQLTATQHSGFFGQGPWPDGAAPRDHPTWAPASASSTGGASAGAKGGASAGSLVGGRSVCEGDR